MTFDYNATRSRVLKGASHIGVVISKPEALRKMSAEQARKARAVNFMTDELWQFRLLGEGALIAEISYGYFMQSPMFGLTVYCVGELAAEADQWDHALSGVFSDEAALWGRLTDLNTGARDRLAALAGA